MCGSLDEKRSEAAEFLFEEPGGAVFLLGLQRIAANQFGERCGFVRGRLPRGTHFIEDGAASRAGDLPGGLAAGESAADNVDFAGHLLSIIPLSIARADFLL